MMHEKVAVSFGEKTKRDPYREALRSVGLDFVENPATVEAFSGLMLTGGTDVDPALYGQERKPETDAPDMERDQRDTALLRDALERDIPILAICRGIQLLNVVLGGTLMQHIDGHRRRGEPNAHSIDIHKATRLASILNAAAYPVNSRHHQCLATLGNGLIIAATADPDGTIEAIELPGAVFVVAVQWHPEDRLETADRKLFQAFAEATQAVIAAAPA